jgi:hypothetical protein
MVYRAHGDGDRCMFVFVRQRGEPGHGLDHGSAVFSLRTT